MRVVLLLSLLLACGGCSHSPVPSTYLQPVEIKKVLYDLMVSENYLSNYLSKDLTIDIKQKRSQLYAEVFKLNAITRKTFYRSYQYYQQHPDLQKALYDSLNTFVTQKKDLLLPPKKRK